MFCLNSIEAPHLGDALQIVLFDGFWIQEQCMKNRFHFNSHTPTRYFVCEKDIHERSKEYFDTQHQQIVAYVYYIFRFFRWAVRPCWQRTHSITPPGHLVLMADGITFWSATSFCFNISWKSSYKVPMQDSWLRSGCNMRPFKTKVQLNFIYSKDVKCHMTIVQK